MLIIKGHLEYIAKSIIGSSGFDYIPQETKEIGS